MANRPITPREFSEGAAPPSFALRSPLVAGVLAALFYLSLFSAVPGGATHLVTDLDREVCLSNIGLHEQDPNVDIVASDLTCARAWAKTEFAFDCVEVGGVQKCAYEMWDGSGGRGHLQGQASAGETLAQHGPHGPINTQWPAVTYQYTSDENWKTIHTVPSTEDPHRVETFTLCHGLSTTANGDSVPVYVEVDVWCSHN